ncbi:MAG: TonB-dependent receptor plug domain-containing protein, partial [Puniceicoccales bacterium]|nr:TonB-dependent receptor plug domain-containing protein [Puniceicoccales bacterium]
MYTPEHTTHTRQHNGRLTPFFFCMAAALSALPAQAEEEPTAPTPTSLPPVVVRAPAIIQGTVTDTFAADSTLVTRRQIEDLGSMDIGSTLRTVPGVTISRHNIAGSYGGGGGGAIFIRGLGASRPGGELITLYDGVPR